MKCHVDSICHAFKYLPLCLLSKSRTETICSTQAWNDLLTQTWLDVFDKQSQDQIIETISSLNSQVKTSSLICTTVEDSSRTILFQYISIGEEWIDFDNDIIILIATLIREDLLEKQSTKKYIQLLSEILKRPSYDKKFTNSITSIRDLTHSINSIIGKTLNTDGTSRLSHEHEIKQQIEDIKSISEDNYTNQKLKLSCHSLLAILDDTSTVIGFTTFIEKRFEASTHCLVMVDRERITMLLETIVRCIQDNIEKTSNKIIIEASLLPQGRATENILKIKYMYIGVPIERNQNSPLVSIINGYTKILNANTKTECIGSRVILTFNIPVLCPDVSGPDTNVESDIKVLIVDDNYVSRTLMKKLGNDMKHQVFEAIDGAETIEKIKALRPQVVFLDVEIPIYDGLEVIQKVRQWEKQENISPTTKIVVITGFPEKYNQASIAECGADGFEKKPLQKDRYKTYVNIFTDLPS